MDEETLKAAIGLTKWAIDSAEKSKDIDDAIHNMKRIYTFLTDTEME